MWKQGKLGNWIKYLSFMENCWKDPVALQDQWAVICYLNHGELQLSSYLSGIYLSCLRYLRLRFGKTTAFYHQKPRFQIVFYKSDWNERKNTLKVKASTSNTSLAWGSMAPGSGGSLSANQWWSIGGRWPGCHAGWSCQRDKVTASVSGETLPTRPALWGESTRTGMCTGGISGDSHIWQRFSNYLAPPSPRGASNETAALRR